MYATLLILPYTLEVSTPPPTPPPTAGAPLSGRWEENYREVLKDTRKTQRISTGIRNYMIL